MKKVLSSILILSLVFAFAGCGSSAEETANLESTSLTDTETDNNAESESTSSGAKAAVVYFSATGNTEAVAKLIAVETGADIYEIIPAEEYSSDDINYTDDSCRANKEMNDSSARPAIGNDLSQTEQYDVIYLGYPIWWGTAPRIIQTYLESYDLSSTKIYTFCTSGSSGIETSVSDLQKYYPGLNIISGKRMNGVAASDIDTWVNGLEQ